MELEGGYQNNIPQNTLVEKILEGWPVDTPKYDTSCLTYALHYLKENISLEPEIKDDITVSVKPSDAFASALAQVFKGCQYLSVYAAVGSLPDQIVNIWGFPIMKK